MQAKNRAPTTEERTKLDSLKLGIDSIKSEWEAKGRNAFLASLQTNTKKRRPRFLKADQSLADYVKEDYSDEQKNLSLGKLLDD